MGLDDFSDDGQVESRPLSFVRDKGPEDFRFFLRRDALALGGDLYDDLRLPGLAIRFFSDGVIAAHREIIRFRGCRSARQPPMS